MSELKLVTRATAKLTGLRHYFTGKPCKYGHIAKRATIGGSCTECKLWRERRHLAGLRVGGMAKVLRNSEKMKLAGGIRRQAFLAGDARYFTGEPCKHGHVAERHTSNGSCIVCENERMRLSNAVRYRTDPVFKRRVLDRGVACRLGPGGDKIRARQREMCAKRAAALLAMEMLTNDPQ